MPLVSHCQHHVRKNQQAHRTPWNGKMRVFLWLANYQANKHANEQAPGRDLAQIWKVELRIRSIRPGQENWGLEALNNENLNLTMNRTVQKGRKEGNTSQGLGRGTASFTEALSPTSGNQNGAREVAAVRGKYPPRTTDCTTRASHRAAIKFRSKGAWHEALSRIEMMMKQT